MADEVDPLEEIITHTTQIVGAENYSFGYVDRFERDFGEYMAETLRLTEENRVAEGLEQQDLWIVSVRDANGEQGPTVAITGNGPHGKQNAEGIAWLLSSRQWMIAEIKRLREQVQQLQLED